MNESFKWSAEDTQNIYNFLIVRGFKFCTTKVDPEYLDRACYALPSSPEKMEDWVIRHLDKAAAQELYKFILRERKNLSQT